jgi:MFS superfamily sulfate permease-like transporter
MLIGVPLALAILYFVGGGLLFLIYALFHVILYFLPHLVVTALVIFVVYQTWKALNQ